MQSPSNLWSKDLKQVFLELKTSEFGLTGKEARIRLKEQGPNTIPDKDKRHWVEVFVSQVNTPLVMILLLAALLSFILGDAFDATIILIIVLVSIFLGFYQENKSEQVIAELRKYISYEATVFRDGEKARVDSRELVPGDIIALGLGDRVPADARIIETQGATVNESALTGESKPVWKTAEIPKGNNSTPQEITNGLFLGTTVIEGYSRAVVISTGKDTFFGKTAQSFSMKFPESDFQKGIRKFGDLLIRIIVLFTIFVFISNYYLGHGEGDPILSSALFALALAVGITPEALPAIVTLTLSKGSLELAKKKVITKKLAAIEDLGNMDVLCTDKTGTLTEEGLRFAKYVDLDKKDSHDVFEYALLCNSAVGNNRIRGNPIDVAIKKHGKEEGIDLSRFTRMQEIPFDFERRRMGWIVSEHKKTALICKGAPESVLEACSHVQMRGRNFPLKEKKKEIQEMAHSYFQEGFSAIGVAYKEIEKKKNYSKQDESSLIFIGFVLLSNPPKHTVPQTLSRLDSLGIRLKILTGDDPMVTEKLCKELGIKGEKILLGSELAGMGKEEFSAAVESHSIFARVSPDQKLKIVEALRANGHVVGFLGDGINDAPALRTADVGISVDTASDVAKGASHLILTRKSLSAICDGVEEGRKIFGNITKYILTTISANQGNMITVSISSLFLPFIPMLPAQILLTNLVSDAPLFSLSGDNVDKSYTKRPQRWNTGMIFRFMLFFGAISTFFDLLFISIMHFFMHAPADEIRTGWFILSLFTEIVAVFSLRTELPFWQSRPSFLLVLASIAAGIAGFAAISWGPIATLFHFVPLPESLILLVLATLIAYFAANEIGKRIFFSKEAKFLLG